MRRCPSWWFTLAPLTVVLGSCGVDQSGLSLAPMPIRPRDAGAETSAGTAGTAGTSGAGGAGAEGPAGASGNPAGGAGTGGTAGFFATGVGGEAAAGTGGNTGLPAGQGGQGVGMGAAGSSGPDAGGPSGVAGTGIGGNPSGPGGEGATTAGTGGLGIAGSRAGATGSAGSLGPGTAGASGPGTAGAGGTSSSGAAGSAAGAGGSQAGANGPGGNGGLGGGSAGRGGFGGGTTTCNASTCGDGCCAAGVCVRARTSARCGAMGAICAACAPCMLCGNGGQCRIDPASQWTINAGSVQLTPTPPAGGGNWDRQTGDLGGRLPDPFIQFENPAGSIDAAHAGGTDTIMDTLTATWSDEVITPASVTISALALMSQNPAWRIWAGDDDGCTAQGCFGTLACEIRQPVQDAQLVSGHFTINNQQNCVTMTLNLVCQP